MSRRTRTQQGRAKTRRRSQRIVIATAVRLACQFVILLAYQGIWIEHFVWRTQKLSRRGSPAMGRLHEYGIYYFVPGLLRHFDAEALVALIAPRPLLTLSGE